MRAASTALQTILNAGGTIGTEVKFLTADMYTLTLSNGTVLRYTGSDIDLVLSGNTFSSMGPRITRNRCKWTIGTEVTELSLTIASLPSDTVGPYTFLQAAVNGVFDGARVLHERVFMPTWGDCSAGSIVMNTYSVADLQIDQLTIQMTCKNLLEPLNIPLPRNTYQAACIHSLYDAGCGLTASSYAVTGVVSSDPSVSKSIIVFPLSASLKPPRPPYTSGVGTYAPVSDYYALGKIVFTSGQNNGISATVKSSSQLVVSGGVNVTINLSFPLGFVPAVGDTFTLYPGCDKSQSTCLNSFANLPNFKGFPYIPVPETLLGGSNAT